MSTVGGAHKMTNTDEVKLVVDVGLASGVITMPIWIVEASAWIQVLAGLIGFIVITLRLALVIREWTRGRDA